MQDAIETAIDRTQVLDVTKLWPNPLDCPDWPVEVGTRRYEGRRGRAGAEDQLERLGQILNRARHIHSPGEDEREAAFNRVFIAKGSMFQHLGLHNLSALDRTTEDQARLIVDAAHVRGYLRRLDAEEDRAAEARKRNELAAAESTFDKWSASVAAAEKELAELADAVARHRQRVEDEKAFHRSREIRHNIRHSHFPAAQAAAHLGKPAPEMPAFVRED